MSPTFNEIVQPANSSMVRSGGAMENTSSNSYQKSYLSTSISNSNPKRNSNSSVPKLLFYADEDEDENLSMDKVGEIEPSAPPLEDFPSYSNTSAVNQSGQYGNDKVLCKICFESPEELYILYKCGHMPFCDNCSKAIISIENRTCPICRGHVKERMRAFL